jgi:hypothetical protein
MRFHDLLPLYKRALLGEDFSGECININTTIIQYFEAVMTIDHRPVWSSFQCTGLSWPQRVDEIFGEQFAVLQQFGVTQRALRM